MGSPYQYCQSKLVTEEQLEMEIRHRHSAGQRVVFTNGVFDILHVGHARYLAEARALGDALVVAVNTDESVHRIKGPARPIVPESERAELLGWLSVVDYITLFATETPVPLIARVKPAIYAKGGDYSVDQLPETEVVQSYGGKVHILSLVKNRSTTNMIGRILDAYAGSK